MSREECAVQTLKGEEITIYGYGSHTRSFCYVDDLVDGLIRMMDTEKGFAGPINLGNPQEHTILQLAEEILALTGSRSGIEFRPLPEDDPKQRQPDISLAKKKLGYQPRVGLRDGLEETISYFTKLVSS